MMKQDPKTAIQGFFCPECKGLVHASGFTGHPFCWGKCYHYFRYEDLLKACHKCGESAQPDSDPPMCTSCLQNSSEYPPNAGSGATPYKGGDEEMDAMEARDLNEDEGAK